MDTDFQISYTLDLLFYIGCMLDAKKRELYADDIEKFMPMLGTISDKYIEKLTKIHQSTPQMIEHIASILIVDDHLHNWTITDLLDRHKRLASTFKKNKLFENVSKDFKKFLNTDYGKVMPLIKTIATDLERLGFKTFWLEEKLPILKERINDYQIILSQFDIMHHLNSWVINKKMGVGQSYVFAYSGRRYRVLLGKYRVISSVIPADDLFERMISYALRVNTYKKFCKILKPTSALKIEFKGHKRHKSFKGITAYAEANLKLALKVYLLETCGNNAMELSGEYPFATEILNHLRTNKKPNTLAAGPYVLGMMKQFSK